MIWKRIRKSSQEEEEKFQKELREAGVSFREKLVMTLTAYVVLVLPCLLLLIGLSAFMLWIMGLL
ncbi:hypothetical protein AMURIS_04562 [Acetatifactor muris]|uniref:Uncharacterized protein n=2 Tax=Acetatifactor muris TaxID=879566 RepID=A0A2K4ZMU9_9FIRM|nr:hypothetical protein [Acetatifactor muris]MCI8800424.1 hypothetical protein [Lachnospiraceae bacterium]SOY31813.1 hypothetical protein AMURIS_04562 [Acetatifactor muris]